MYAREELLDRLGGLVQVLRGGQEVDEGIGVGFVRVLLQRLQEGLVRLLVLLLLQERDAQACFGGK